MWNELAKRWIDLFFWWLPRDKATEHSSDAVEQDTTRASEQAARDAGVAKPRSADDLTVLKGIGPVVQEKLRSLGIATFRDLATADPERLTEQLQGKQPISKAMVRAWTEAAREQPSVRN